MSYNRWMPRQYHNGGELYHYGVKGMKWKNHTYASRPDGQLPTTMSGATWYDESQQRSEQEQADATYQRYQEIMEARKPAWQKKWEHSDVKKQLDGILAKIKGHMPKLKKREKKSHLKVTFSDGTSKDL